MKQFFKLAAFAVAISLTSNCWAVQSDCGCSSNGVQTYGAYGAVDGSSTNCGRAISNGDAAGLWASYCHDDCTFTGCSSDACKLGNLFRNRHARGGCGSNFDSGYSDVGYVDAGYVDTGYVSGGFVDSGCGSAGGGCRLFSKLAGGGGLFSKLGSRGGGFGNGGSCFGWPGSPGCGFGGCGGGFGAGGGLLGHHFGHGHRCGGGCGGGFLKRLFGKIGSGHGHGHGHGCGGGGGCGLLSKVGRRHGGGFFSHFTGSDYGNCDFQSSVSGQVTSACGCATSSAMPMNVDQANTFVSPMGNSVNVGCCGSDQSVPFPASGAPTMNATPQATPPMAPATPYTEPATNAVPLNQESGDGDSLNGLHPDDETN